MQFAVTMAVSVVVMAMAAVSTSSAATNHTLTKRSDGRSD